MPHIQKEELVVYQVGYSRCLWCLLPSMRESLGVVFNTQIHQNIRIRKTKASELLTDVYTHKFHVICMFQKWINISCINYNRFPGAGLVHVAERVSDAKSHKEGPLISISDSISGLVHRLKKQLGEIYFSD
jgi:hypothetical protein